MLEAGQKCSACRKDLFQEEKERFSVRDEEILINNLLSELKALVSISPR